MVNLKAMSQNWARSFPAAHEYYFATAPFNLALSWLVQLHKTTVVLVVVSSHAKDFLKDTLEEKSNMTCLTGVEPQSLSRSHPKKLEDEVSWCRPEAAGGGQPHTLPGMGWSGASPLLPPQSHPGRPTSPRAATPSCCPQPCSNAVPSCFCRENDLGNPPQGFRSPSCCRVRGLQPGQGACPQDLWVG